MQAEEKAQEFVARYERFWRDGARDIHAVYMPDSVLCGYEIVRGHDGIGRILAAIRGQGWTDISIEVVECAATADAILLACRYVARSGTDEMTAKSSYVLVEDDGVWKAAMHTAA